MMIVASRGRFLLFRTPGAFTLTPDDDGHREAAIHDARDLDALALFAPGMRPTEAWVVEITDETPPRFVIIKQLQLEEHP